MKTLQKQYQQRSGILHQQPPFDPIKHAHYHMNHSQSANVIVDVENHETTGGTLLLTSSDIKSPHICSNSMQISATSGTTANNATGDNVCQTKVPLSETTTTSYNTKSNHRGQGVSEHVVQTIPIKQQSTQQQFNRNTSTSYNSIGMMTLPKGGLNSSLMQQQHQQHQHHHQQQQQQQQHLSSISYGPRDTATLPRNMNMSSQTNTSSNLGNYK